MATASTSISVKPMKHLYLLFVSSSIISYLYALITNRLNGDFLGVEVKLSFILLTLNLLFSILPFFITWKIYLYLEKKQVKRKISIPINFFRLFLLFILIWNIIVTIVYGVNILAADPYQAPALVKPIIQIMNRFNYAYGVFLYVLITPKKDKIVIIFVILLLLLAYLRAGLGIFMYLGMLFYIKYYEEISILFRKYILIILPFIFISSTIINELYRFRDKIRHQEYTETVPDPIFGKFFGRLSSFSDSAFILQNIPYFLTNSLQLDQFYFQKTGLGGVISQDFMPSNRPEKILFNYYYSDRNDNVAYMAGTQGILYMSLMKSVSTFFLNLFTIGIYIASTFYFFRLLRFDYANELAFMLLLYVLMSGVSNEYAFLVFSIFVFVVLFLMVNVIKEIENSKIKH